MVVKASTSRDLLDRPGADATSGSSRDHVVARLRGAAATEHDRAAVGRGDEHEADLGMVGQAVDERRVAGVDLVARSAAGARPAT